MQSLEMSLSPALRYWLTAAEQESLNIALLRYRLGTGHLLGNRKRPKCFIAVACTREGTNSGARPHDDRMAKALKNRRRRGRRDSAPSR